MSNDQDNTINATLQILFGITGIFSVVVGLFGLHHRDALVFVLYRRIRSHRTTGTLLVLTRIYIHRH
jgi:hypothetical protein